MMKRLLLSLTVIAGFAFGGSSAIAQTASTEAQAGTQLSYPENVYGIGLSASLCSGMGLSFKQHIANIPIAYQITGGVIKINGLTLWDAGVEAQYDLSVTSNRLYGALAWGYYYSGKTSNELSGPARFGAGVGYEMPFSKNIGTSVDLLVTFFMPDGTILPLPSIGMHFYFK